MVFQKVKLMKDKHQWNVPADKFIKKLELMFNWVKCIKFKYFTVKIVVFTFAKCKKVTLMFFLTRTLKFRKIKERRKPQNK